MDMSNATRSSQGTILPGTWRCLVCQKPTNEIHVLPCQHKFCMGCLELWAGIYIDMYHGTSDEFPCQICWKLYIVPDQGMKAYKQDYQVNILEDSLKSMSVGQGHNGGQGAGPFGYNADRLWDAGVTAESVFAQQSQEMDMNEAKEQDVCQINSNGGLIANINCDDEPVNMSSSQSPGVSMTHSPGGSVYPSMVSHMAPQPFKTAQYENLDSPRSAGSNYCMRSHHLYMHMA